MAGYQLALRCPYCQCILEVQPPNNWYNVYSFKEPLKQSYPGEVKKQEIVCQNPECQKKITIYWHAPIAYIAAI
jgi:hypothetical protein